MNFKIKKEYIFLGVFAIIVSITGYVLIRFIVISDASTVTDPKLVVKPAYLLQPIPRIDKLTTILDNPKFKDMLYKEIFFKEVEVSEKGRPNPFFPFLQKKGEE